MSIITVSIFVSRDRDVMLIHLVAGREGALNFSARLSRAEHSSVTVQGNTLFDGRHVGKR